MRMSELISTKTKFLCVRTDKGKKGVNFCDIVRASPKDGRIKSEI